MVFALIEKQDREQGRGTCVTLWMSSGSSREGRRAVLGKSETPSVWAEGNPRALSFGQCAAQASLSVSHSETTVWQR